MHSLCTEKALTEIKLQEYTKRVFSFNNLKNKF